MIPKVIHYCWFGGKEKPLEVLQCIESWKKYLPDYDIIEWNETNFSIEHSIAYVKEAYEHKKWAFVSDYVRLDALYNYGGIYFDTDVEVFKSFNELLENESFFGFESKDYVASAVMGCEPKCIIIKEFIESYRERKFIINAQKLDTTTNVIVLTELLCKYGLKKNGREQTLANSCKIYPQKYFASNSFINIFGKYNKEIYAYHHCLASWYDYKRGNDKRALLHHYAVGVMRNLVGTDILNNIREKK